MYRCIGLRAADAGPGAGAAGLHPGARRDF